MREERIPGSRIQPTQLDQLIVPVVRAAARFRRLAQSRSNRSRRFCAVTLTGRDSSGRARSPYLRMFLITSAGLADAYFHRGISTGTGGGLVLHPTGRELATNADLTIIQPTQLDGVAEQLQIAGFRYVRQPIDVVHDRASARDIRLEPLRSNCPVTDEPWHYRSLLYSKGLQVGPSRRNPRRVDAPPTDLDRICSLLSGSGHPLQAELDSVRSDLGSPKLPGELGRKHRSGDYISGTLTVASNAIKSVQPTVQIVLAEFEPFPAQGKSDLESLNDVYQAGSSEFFDIVTATVDGGGRSPYDREIRKNRVNLSRVVLFREAMEDAGDGEKPVWAGRYGWSAGSGPHQVTERQQAEFVIDGIERAREEWPWMGPMFMWEFLPLQGDPETSYALLTTDGKSTELFGAISEFSRTPGAEAAPTGFVPVDARSLQYQGRWTAQELPPQVYRTTAATNDSVTIQFKGSTLTAFLRQSSEAGTIALTLDGEEIGEIPATSLQTLQAFNAPLELVSGLDYELHELTLTLASEGELTIGGAVVDRDQPSLWPVALITLAAVADPVYCYRDVVYVVPERLATFAARAVSTRGSIVPFHSACRRGCSGKVACQ